MIVKSTALISALKNTKSRNESSEILLNKLIEDRENFLFADGKFALSINIDTDEDFFIDGKSEYLNRMHIRDHESAHDALLRFIDSSDIQVHESKKNKLDFFLNQIKSEECKVELNEDGVYCINGNQTLVVKIINPCGEMYFGDITVDLAE